MEILITVIAVGSSVGVAIVLWLLYTPGAPLGYQDDEAFHRIKRKRGSLVRKKAARSLMRGSAKRVSFSTNDKAEDAGQMVLDVGLEPEPRQQD